MSRWFLALCASSLAGMMARGEAIAAPPPPAAPLTLGGTGIAGTWTDATHFRTSHGEVWAVGGVFSPASGRAQPAAAPADGWAALAVAARHLVALREWACHPWPHASPPWDTTSARHLDCPDLAAALVRQGLAGVAVSEPAAVRWELIEAQDEARRRRTGFWQWIRGPWWVASLESAAEQPARRIRTATADYAVDARVGVAEMAPHEARYAACALVCIHGACARWSPPDMGRMCAEPAFPEE